MALKRHLPDVRFSGNKVDPDEINMRQQYSVVKPSIGVNTVGTLAAGTVAAAYTMITLRADYPRNVVFVVTGPSGGVGGTAVIVGKDQFGVTQSETITMASANAGGTVSGTKIFDTFTSAAYSPNGVDNTSTTTVGFSKGTATTDKHWLGLPVRIGAVSDVKRVTWIANGTRTDILGGTVSSTTISTATHAFCGTGILAATDEFYVEVLSSYNGENKVNVA